MKQFAVMDRYGVTVYELSGESIEVLDRHVLVFDQDAEIKAIINLLPGHSVMEVYHVLDGVAE